MRIGIVGSRHFPELHRVGDYVRSLPGTASLVTGSASGVDAEATRVARARGLPVRVLGASFEEAADAGSAVERNRRLVQSCELLVAFWDGSSLGTRGTVERALDSGREVHVFVPVGTPDAQVLPGAARTIEK